jgi:hypothetical protein
VLVAAILSLGSAVTTVGVYVVLVTKLVEMINISVFLKLRF